MEAQQPTPVPVQMDEQPKAVEVQPEQVQPMIEEVKDDAEKAVEKAKEEASKVVEEQKVMDNQPQPQTAEQKAAELEKKANEARMEAEAEKLFNLADKDGNGSLSPVELRAFLTKNVKLNEEETEYLFDKFGELLSSTHNFFLIF
uniref:EF-hand domain-containing protein n=1 Tax=Lotharella globosa TaxID=91324 RepID=A0A6V3LYT5_9EUKA